MFDITSVRWNIPARNNLVGGGFNQPLSVLMTTVINIIPCSASAHPCVGTRSTTKQCV